MQARVSRDEEGMYIVHIVGPTGTSRRFYITDLSEIKDFVYDVWAFFKQMVSEIVEEL